MRPAGQRAANGKNAAPSGPQAAPQQQKQVSDEDMRRVYGWTVEQVLASGGFSQERMEMLRSALQAADRSNRGALPFPQVSLLILVWVIFTSLMSSEERVVSAYEYIVHF